MKVILMGLMLLFANSYFVFGQTKKEEIMPLHLFFKNNFDSTIIFYTYDNWNWEPNYKIVSKKGNEVYYYTYHNPYKRSGGRNPEVLFTKFFREGQQFKNIQPDTNRYFLPFQVVYTEKEIFWKKVNAYNIWNIKERNNYTESEMGADGIRYTTNDGTIEVYYLITNSEIKTLQFYDADFFEKHIPGNINRQQEIKTRNEILKIFSVSAYN